MARSRGSDRKAQRSQRRGAGVAQSSVRLAPHVEADPRHGQESQQFLAREADDPARHGRRHPGRRYAPELDLRTSQNPLLREEAQESATRARCRSASTPPQLGLASIDPRMRHDGREFRETGPRDRPCVRAPGEPLHECGRHSRAKANHDDARRSTGSCRLRPKRLVRHASVTLSPNQELVRNLDRRLHMGNHIAQYVCPSA